MTRPEWLGNEGMYRGVSSEGILYVLTHVLAGGAELPCRVGLVCDLRSQLHSRDLQKPSAALKSQWERSRRVRTGIGEILQ